MKKLLSVSNKDFIITTSTNVVYENNLPKWINEESKLAEYKGIVTSICFYEDEYKEGYPTNEAKKIFIDVESIKKLYAEIEQVEAFRCEETYYKDMVW